MELRTISLEEQVYVLFKRTNYHSIQTRKSYLSRTKKFCGFIEEEFKVLKFVNLKEKHILRYVQHERERGVSDATIRTDIEAVKFFYKLSGGKNILPETKELCLERKEYSEKKTIIWTEKEIQSALNTAYALGRKDIEKTIELALIGKTLDEIVMMRDSRGRYVVTDDIKCDINGQKNKIRSWIHNNRKRFSDRALTFDGIRREDYGDNK